MASFAIQVAKSNNTIWTGVKQDDVVIRKSGNSTLYLGDPASATPAITMTDSAMTIQGVFRAASLLENGVALSNKYFDSITGQLAYNAAFAASNTAFYTSNVAYSATSALDNYLPLSGGSLSGGLNIAGDLTVMGTTTTVNTQNLLIKDNLLTINSSMSNGVPPSSLQSGIEVRRGDYSNYYFVFDEASDLFKVGESNKLQAVATRDDNLGSGFPYFDASQRMLVNRNIQVNDVTGLDTVVTFTSNAGVFGSNVSVFGSNTGAFGSNNSVWASNTSAWASNNGGVFGSNAGAFGSNNSVWASNTSAWASNNGGVFGSNTSVWASNTSVWNSNISVVMNDRVKPSYAEAITAVNSNMKLQQPASANAWYAACWAAELGIFAAVSTSGSSNRVMTSSDGINWVSRTSAVDNSWVTICWAAELNLFVAASVSGTGNRVMTSSDGITWTTQTTPTPENNWRSIAWSPQLGIFVVVGDTGTGRVMTSPNGITWTAGNAVVQNNWVSVCWSPQLEIFVAVSYSGTGNRVMTSSDGINWTSRSSAADNNWNSVCWSPQLRLFVAVAYSGVGNRVMTSPDGINWTLRSSPADYNWVSVCWSPELGMFMAVSNTGTGTRIMTSLDGITWTLRASAANSAWSSVCWSRELSIFACVGTNAVMTSIKPALPASKSTLLVNPYYMMVNNSNGYVGVWTSNPQYHLDVNGNINSGGLFVSGSNIVTQVNAASNTAYNASNIAVFASNAGTFGSNTAAFGSNAAVWSSNQFQSYLPLVGGTVTGSLTVGGDLTVSGTTTTIDTQTILVKDNILTINSSLSNTAPPSTLISGIEVRRGTACNYFFVFEEATDLFKVGLCNQLQAVTTRDDALASGYPYYDGAQSKLINRAITIADVTNLNTTLTNTSNLALSASNVAYITSNAAFPASNVAYISSNVAFTGSNAAFTGSNVAYITSNAAFPASNVAYISSNVAFTGSNVAYITSNVVFPSSNVAYITSNVAFRSSNVAYITSNVAYITSNVAFTGSNAAFTGSNVAYITSNVAFPSSNVAYITSNIAFPASNAAYITSNVAITASNAAFFSSNNALLKTGGTVTGQITSTVAMGTAPFVVASSNVVTNLNADFLDGLNSTFFLNATNINAGVLNPTYGGTGTTSLAASKLLVGNGTNAVLQPTNLHWDNDNSRLGIGTSTPQFPFDVAANIGTRAMYFYGAETNMRMMMMDHDATADWTQYGLMQVVQNSTTLTTHSNQAAISFVRSGNYSMGVGYQQGTNIFGFGAAVQSNTHFTPIFLCINPASCNVGIGLSNPAHALDVAGNIRYSGQVISTAAMGTAPFVVASSNVVANLNVGFLEGSNTAQLRNATNINAGLLSTAYGGTGTSNTVGTGSVVFNTSPAFTGTAAFSNVTASNIVSSNVLVTMAVGDPTMTLWASNAAGRPTLQFLRGSSVYGADALVDYRLVNSNGVFLIGASNSVTSEFNLMSFFGSNGAVNVNVPMNVSGQIQGSPVDTSNVPAFTWSNDSNTGMYHISTGALGFALRGNNFVTMSNNLLGVGTSNPQNTLDVLGQLNTTPVGASATSLTGGPFFIQTRWDLAGTSHTLSNFTRGDNSGGTLFIQVANKSSSGATAKTGNMQLSYIRTFGNTVDLFTIASHRSATMTTLSAIASGSNVVITTDSDCAIAWTSIGSF